MSIAGLVLAAGEGRRFGGPKALARLDGERLVDRAVRLAAAGGLDPIYVVSGAVELQVEGATVVPNPSWASGMGSSLQAGLVALGGASAVTAAVVFLVDTPWLSAQAVRRLVSSAAEAAGEAAIATYGGRRGHPVLLGASIWGEVGELAHDDVAAKAWLRANPGRVLEVDCTGLGDPRDIDRPEDLTRR